MVKERIVLAVIPYLITLDFKRLTLLKLIRLNIVQIETPTRFYSVQHSYHCRLELSFINKGKKVQGQFYKMLTCDSHFEHNSRNK